MEFKKLYNRYAVVIMETGSICVLRFVSMFGTGLFRSDAVRSTLDRIYELLSWGRLATLILLTHSLDPASFNVYDSLGEAYTVAGERELAIENYEISVRISPNNKDGVTALKKLKTN